MPTICLLLVLAFSDKAVAADAPHINWEKLWSKEKKVEQTPKAQRQETISPASQRRAPSVNPSSASKANQPPASIDENLDSENENKLAVGERMLATQQYSAAIELSKQVLRKYPGNRRAASLKVRAQTELRKLQEKFFGKRSG